MDRRNSSVVLADRGMPAGGMESLLEGGYDYWEPQQGEIVRGQVTRVGPTEVLVDIGSKSEGIVAGRELQNLEPELLGRLRVGDEVFAYVLTPQDREGNTLLSLARARLESDWQLAESRFQKEEVFESSITGFNKGGLLVHLGKVRGFLPASQIDRVRWNGKLSPEDLEGRLAEMVGQPVQLKVIELDRKRNRLIFSERAALSQHHREQKAQLLTQIQEGEVRHGVVTNLCDFGAFVDLGGVDGLVHLSELSWKRVARPQDVLDVGQEVDVCVLSVDQERGRIGLSLKRLQPEPWSQVEQMYTVGQLVEGQVTNLTKFGAFVRLDGSDLEGLIHISELSDEPISQPSEVLQKGDQVTVKIVRIDSERRRIGLSFKAAGDAVLLVRDDRDTEDEGLGNG